MFLVRLWPVCSSFMPSVDWLIALCQTAWPSGVKVCLRFPRFTDVTSHLQPTRSIIMNTINQMSMRNPKHTVKYLRTEIKYFNISNIKINLIFLTGSLWRRQSQQSFNTLTPFHFLSHSLHVSAPTGHPQVRYTINLKDYFHSKLMTAIGYYLTVNFVVFTPSDIVKLVKYVDLG
jgi:hypothetical protein